VVAAPEYLGKYRLHGANLFQAEGKPFSRAQIEHRMTMRAALLAEIQQGLRRNGHDTRSADLRAYLMQWRKAQEQDGFTLDALGRWQYFRHLLSHPWTYGAIMTQRHRVYSYMKAHVALVLGYHHLHLFEDAGGSARSGWLLPPKRPWWP
jgi:hypothetical protein